MLTTSNVSNQDTYAPKLSNRSLEISGYKEGIGTIVATNTITFTSTQTLKLENAYRLDASANYLKTVTAVSNTSASNVENLRLWIGTRDDFVGTSDANFKLKGNLSSNGFEAISTQNQQAKAVRISENNDGVSGAAVLFYSTSTGADTSVDSCCQFSRSTNKDPRASAISTPKQDGSYALFLRLNDIAPGQSDGMTWYYAAAPISQINSVVTAVAQQSATNVAFTLAPLSGSRDYKGTPYSLGSLWGSTDIFGSNYSTWLLGSDYTFQYAGNTVTGFTNAGNYTNIGINILKTGFQVAASGNTLGSLSISPAALTVSANAASKTYDGLSFSGGNGVSYNGFVNNETAAVLSGALAYAGTAQNARNAGNYSIIPSGLNANNGNYNLSFVNGNLTIAPRPIALTADAKSKLQGQVDPALSYSLACGNFTENCGLVAGESLAGSLKRVAGEAVRNYAIQQDTLSNQNNPNYLISYTEQNLSIAEAPGKPNAIASVQQTDAERNAISYIQQATRKPAKKASTASTDSTIDGPNISAGLAFVEIASISETANNSSVQGAALERGAGRDPAGFMRVFVVDGGINLPKELMPRSPTINDEELRRQPQR
ncbi:MAG: MBG domain-containing protein [Burkholderiales bacterium]|nr:MBG domain-containing protein [Burkholderiales bacterium]